MTAANAGIVRPRSACVAGGPRFLKLLASFPRASALARSLLAFQHRTAGAPGKTGAVRASIYIAILLLGAAPAWSQSADMAVLKSGPATVLAGSNVTYTITVTNNGPDPAQSASMSDTLPVGETFVSFTQATGPAFLLSGGSTSTATIATLNSGATATFVLVGQAGAGLANGSTLSNTATVSSSTTDPNPGNNTSTVNSTVNATADLAVTKSGPATVLAGSNVTYTITVTNNGPVAALNTTMSDALPVGETFVSFSQASGPSATLSGGATSTATWSSLANGATAAFVLVGHASSGLANGSTLSNTATVTSSTTDPNPGNNTSTVNSTVNANDADLSITKTGPATVPAGSNVTYTITVSNAGPAAAQNAAMSDTLPAGETFVSFTQATGPAFLLSGGSTSTATIATLNSGATATFVLVGQAGAGLANGSTLSNTATVTSSTTDPNPGNNTSTVTSTVVSGPVPTAQSKSVTVLAGTTKTIDLTSGATNGPFTKATLVSLAPASAGTAVITSAPGTFLLSFTPAANFTAVAVATFTLTNSFGTSAPATVTFTVVPRPDPSKDPDVIGLLNAQVTAAERFANAQISNFDQRLESLHEDGYGPQGQGIAFGSSDQAPSSAYAFTQARPGASGKSPFDDVFARADQPTGTNITKASPRAPLPNFSFWSSGYVNFGSTGATNFVNAAPGSSLDFTTSGVTVGVDRRFSDYFTAGLGVGYGRDDANIGVNGTHSRGQTLNAGAYGSYRPLPGLFTDGVIGFGALTFDSQRFVVANNDFASGSRTGSEIFGSLTAGFEHRWQQLLLSPYARVNVISLWLDAFSETGDPTGSLTFSNQSATNLTGILGLRGKYDMLMSWGVFSPRFRAEFNHAWQSGGATSLQYADFLAGPTYFITTIPAEANYATLGLGADFKFGSAAFINFDYQTAFGYFDTRTHLFRVRIGSRW
jgi:uncharacterized repeat protein (TIGR01451 family)